MSGDAPRRPREELVAEDAEARFLAQTCFGQPVVLEAGAGTGKTTALVARVVAWALGEGWARAAAHLAASGDAAARESDRVAARVLQRMVAITFTETAAAEMAKRVGATFAKIASGAAPDELAEKDGIDLRALALDASDRRTRAKALASALDRLVVRTIHAFARRLLATHPLEAGLHPAFEIDPDGLAAAQVVREILEARLREAYGDPGDPVLLGLAARGVTAATLEDELLALVRSATPAARLGEDPFEAERIEELRHEIAGGLERLCALAGSGLAGNSKTRSAGELVATAGEACNRLREPVAGGVAGIEALQEVLASTVEPCLGRLAKWAKGDFTQSEERALGPVALAEIQPLAGRLHPRLEHLCDLDARKLDLARRALAPLLAEAAEAVRARGIVSYDDLLRGAARLLAERPDVAARERAQIDQLLIDEFQDTDGLQCAMIEKLALAEDAGERPGLFLVGDPKQSIYGWRGADLGAYDDFVEKVRAAGGRVCRLYVNRRSVQPILDEVERVIEPAMHAETGVQPPFQPLLAHRPAGGFTGDGFATVEYWVSCAWPPPEKRTSRSEATAIEARAVAQDVAALVREHGVAPRDVGVLVRSFTEIDEYLTALREARVPVAVARDRSYYRRREIVDALCLVRCVVDPGDALAFVALLRSSVAGVPDAALLPLWRERLPSLVARLPGGGDPALDDVRRAVFAAARAVAPGVPGIEIAGGWEHSLVFVIEALGRLRESFARESSDVFVERLRRFLLFEASEAARPLGAFRVANLERFFREIRDALAEGADPFELLRHLRRSVSEGRDAQEARPLETADDVVQVMSIHGAKGLGFVHTYVVELHREPRGRRPAEEPGRAGVAGGRTELRLLGERTPGFLGIEALEDRTAAAEHVRTLYVAMTRAKDRLVLAGLWPEPGNRSAALKSHVALLAGRAGGAPPLSEELEKLSVSGGDRFDANETRWVFPALRRDEGAAREASGAGAGPGPAERAALAEADSQRLAADRACAHARMARRFGGPVTQDAHEWSEELLDRGRDGEASVREDAGVRDAGASPPATPGADGACGTDARAGGVPGAHGAAALVPVSIASPGGEQRAYDPVASAVGTALHHALEGLDLAEEPERALVLLCEAAERALGGSGLGEGALDQARARARELADRFVSSGLLARLRRLAPNVVARELSVLLPPGAGDAGPAGYVSGRIDLVYLDPETGDPVVADYKTGRTETDGEIREAAARYAAQGAHYVRAVREALGLEKDPRFELWFLHAGRVEVAG